MRLLLTQNSTLNTQHFLRLLPLSTQNSKLKTQNFFLFILAFLLVFFLFSSPCFAQGAVGAHLPSLPNLPSGENDAGGATPDQPVDSVSPPIDAQGEPRTDADGVKASKYKIEYNGNTKRIQSKIENSRGTRQQDSKIENGKGTRQEDLEAGELPGQNPGLSDTRKFGFQYQSPLLGGIGF